MPRMRASVWIASALGACAATSLLVLVQCGSIGDNGSPTFDAGPVDGSGGDGSSGSDGSFDSGGVDAGLPPSLKIIAMNASPDLPAVRLCIAVGDAGTTFITHLAVPSDDAHPMPESNFPGIPVGGGIALPYRGNVPHGPMTIYAVVASRISVDVDSNTNPTYCAQRICTGSGCLTEGLDYYRLPSVDPSTFLGRSTLLAIVGSTASLDLRTFTLDDTLRSQNAGAQVAQLSPGLDTIVPGASTRVTIGLLDPAADAAVLAWPTYLTVAPASAQAFSLPEAGADQDYARQGLVVSVLAPDASVAQRFAFPLAAIQTASNPSILPQQYFAPQSDYVFGILGDPTDAAAQLTLPDGAPNPSYDGHGLHVVAYPTMIEAPDARAP